MNHKEFSWQRSRKRCVEIAFFYTLFVLGTSLLLGTCLWFLLLWLKQTSLLGALFCFVLPLLLSFLFFLVSIVLLSTQHQKISIRKEEIVKTSSLNLTEEIRIHPEEVKRIYPTRFLWFYGFRFIVNGYGENGIPFHPKKEASIPLFRFLSQKEALSVKAALEQFGYAKNSYLRL